VLFIFIEMTSF